MIQHKAKAWLMEFHEKNLTQAQNAITKDWKAEFPELAIQGPRHLLKRVGPLLLGIDLARYSPTEYEPGFHVHFLGNSKDGFCLTMRTSVLPPPGFFGGGVAVSDHKAVYKDCAKRLREEAPLRLEGPLTVAEVVAAYQKYSTSPMGEQQLAYLYQDAIKLLACYDFADKARGLLQEILERTEGRDYKFGHHGGREAYIERMRDAIAHPETIRETIEQQIVQHKVGRLPFSEFADAVPVTALNEPKA
ncbi:MAG: hypothetical protein ACKO5E_01035 [bacterium]